MLEGPARITDYSSGCSQAGEKIDVQFCPDVRFGCSVHRMMGFLIQKKAGEQSSRLRLCTRGTWGEGAVGSCRFAREGGTGAKHSTTASRDLFVGDLCHSTHLRQAGLVRATRHSPGIARLSKVTRRKGTALRCAVFNQFLTQQDALRALPLLRFKTKTGLHESPLVTCQPNGDRNGCHLYTTFL